MQVAIALIPPPPTKFVKGYVVIESDIELDVVAVYTGAQGANTFLTTFHTERVQPRCVPVCEDLAMPLHTGVAPWQTVAPTVGFLGPVALVAPLAAGWVPPPPGSQWVSQLSTDGGTAAPTIGSSPRTYDLCFNLCSGFTPPAPFTIQVVADDSAKVSLNGSQIGGVVPLNVVTPLQVTAANLASLHAGRNCFRVEVTNAPAAATNATPTGFALAGLFNAARGKCPCGS